MKTEEIKFMKLTADTGKIFKRVLDGELMGSTLILGINDVAENYVEVDNVAEEVV